MPSSILSLLASSIGGIQGEEEEKGQRDPNKPQRYDIDPSNPSRKVKHKKINSAFLKHQKWKEEQERKEKGRVTKEEIQKDESRDTKMANQKEGRIVELPPGANDEVTLRSTDKQGKQESKISKGKGKSKGNSTIIVEERGLPYLLFKWSLVVILCAIGIGHFIAGDALWGYRGKYVQKETFLPPTKIFSPAELAQYDGKDENKPIYVSYREEENLSREF